MTTTQTAPTIISSQRFRDPEIVEKKRESQDYTVTLSPVFNVDRVKYQTVIDGHHSLEAARLDGREPEFNVADLRTSDNIAYLDRGEIEKFLEITWMGDDYYDVNTGALIF